MKEQNNLKESMSLKHLMRNTMSFIDKQFGLTAKEFATAELMLNSFKTLALEESNTAGRLLQAIANINQEEIASLPPLNEMEQIEIYSYAFALGSLQKDKTLAFFALDNSGLKSNKELLSSLINILFLKTKMMKDIDYLKSLLSLDIDLTSLKGSISCLFSKLLEHSGLTEDYLISLLPKVSDVNVNNQRRFKSVPDPQQNPDGSCGHDDLADQPEPYPLLMHSIDARRFKLAKKFVEMGADVNFAYTDSTGFEDSVLTTAYNSGDKGIVEFLLGNGCTSEPPFCSFNPHLLYPQALHSFRRLSSDAKVEFEEKEEDSILPREIVKLIGSFVSAYELE